MRVLHICASDGLGGASRAAIRLHEALLEEGIDSEFLVQRKISDSVKVRSPYKGVKELLVFLRIYYERFVLYKKLQTKAPFTIGSLGSNLMRKAIADIKPDLLHLHWIGKGTIGLHDIERIGLPVVWSLHDMWPFTGGCHYDNDCMGYARGCGNCPMLTNRHKNDLSWKWFLKKKKIYQQLGNRLTVVGLSEWINREATRSEIFAANKVINLPNPINITSFKPVDQLVARNIMSIPADKKVILFGSMGSTSEKRKGFAELVQALKKIDPHDVLLCVFGTSRIHQKIAAFEMKAVGTFRDDVSLSLLYNCANVVVTPSLQENLSNVIMESMSCGTPVVAFDIGGNRDLITHKHNGYLSKMGDTNDLAEGIQYVLNSGLELGKMARESVEKQFASKVVVDKYIKLYSSIV